MELKLNFLERNCAIHIYKSKTQAGLDEWALVAKALKVLSFSKEDLEYYEVKHFPETKENPRGRSEWNTEKATEEKVFEIGEDEYFLLKERFKELENSKKIEGDMISLAIKILRPENQKGADKPPTPGQAEPVTPEQKIV